MKKNYITLFLINICFSLSFVLPSAMGLWITYDCSHSEYYRLLASLSVIFLILCFLVYYYMPYYLPIKLRDKYKISNFLISVFLIMCLVSIVLCVVEGLLNINWTIGYLNNSFKMYCDLDLNWRGYKNQQMLIAFRKWALLPALCLVENSIKATIMRIGFARYNKKKNKVLCYLIAQPRD